ncbi:hypothetical protein HII31_10401 [Pseudocercospora fuligena]|uniref:ATP-grasp domain-containing protein n=1 Tax=Pseudocercospora fuligena TaxID=685502 RepID=A0A8H6VF85_9PEZI|nr:hypothetical protein HII31_10401 [Pseudocercospora fuligena]
MSGLPTIVLDRTLADLYGKPEHPHTNTAHIYCGVTSASDLTPDFPRNLKYIYQEAAFNDPQHNGSDESARRSLAIKMLSLVPQRDSFITGSSPVIFFHLDQTEKGKAQDKEEQARTLAVLEESQRPKVLFCQGPLDVHYINKQHNISGVTSKVVVDAVAEATDNPPGRGLTSLVELDKIWYLNSKEALAKSGLPTPKSTVTELEEYEDGGKFCTPGIEDSLDESPFDSRRPSGYNVWMEQQVSAIITDLRKRPLPFVVKGNQLFGGAGTWVLTSEEDREELIDDLMTGGLLRKLLSYITASNEHLNLGTVVIQEVVHDPVQDVGLTFFVKADGTSEFLAASEQMIDRGSSAWVGSTIDYSKQGEWHKTLEPLMQQIGFWLREHAYIGPVGADILETKSGERLIVDLNVRTTGSLCLPLLSKHFTSRELNAASSFSITVEQDRDQFIGTWRKEFEEGRFIIVAWYHEASLGTSYGDVVVGAEDQAALQEVIEKVRSMSGSVTF